MALLPQHIDDLRRSGLTDETISAAGLRSEVDPVAVQWILNWQRPATGLGPCLIFQFRHVDGTLNGFARVKPDAPRLENGKPVKYEQPRQAELRPYFPPGTISTIADPAAAVGICEGEKKALAADQAGLPCIGLTGVFAWQKARPKNAKGRGVGERKLIDDLAAIQWRGRPVWICFDSDEKRKPNVNLARCELARVLCELGADVRFVDLPLGPRGADGLPAKVGVDDYVVTDGEQAFRDFVARAMAPPAATVRLSEYRSHLRRARLESVGRPGVYLDTSPPGSGKTFADLSAAELAGKSLTVLPTHQNCREAVRVFDGAGLFAVAYPTLNEETCKQYIRASRAIGAGLSVSAALCPSCASSATCDYRDAMAAADGAAHRLCTHRRAAVSFRTMADGRPYIAIHEDVASLLRPAVEICSGLEDATLIAQHVRGYGWKAEDYDLVQFCCRVETAALQLTEHLAVATSTAPIDFPPFPVNEPRGIDHHFHRAMEAWDVWPDGDTLRVCRAIAAGDLAELVVRVDQVFGKGREVKIRKSIIGVWQTKLPTRAAVWLCDATADPCEIEAMTGRPVANKTPGGELAQFHCALQVPIDVKKSTSPARVAAVLRGVLAQFPEARRVGVICDRQHVATITGMSRKSATLDAASRARISKIEHFRSGEGRGSNEWLTACDLIVVLGTPRVPPEAVKTRLIQSGKVAASTRDGGWERNYWSGLDATGQRHTVPCLGYSDHDWHIAHHSVVVAELLQAVGRGRGICPNGLSVVVLSNEPLGLPLLAVTLEPISTSARQVVEAIQKLSDTFPTDAANPSETLPQTPPIPEIPKPHNQRLSGQNPTAIAPPEGFPHNQRLSGQNPIYIIGLSPDSRRKWGQGVSSAEIAAQVAKDDRWVRRILSDLHKRGLVERVGLRGGWRLPTSPTTDPRPSSPLDASGVVDETEITCCSQEVMA